MKKLVILGSLVLMLSGCAGSAENMGLPPPGYYRDDPETANAFLMMQQNQILQQQQQQMPIPQANTGTMRPMGGVWNYYSGK
jgi:uncharacterized lipoprotein